jgi:hypothetical protein
MSLCITDAFVCIKKHRREASQPTPANTFANYWELIVQTIHIWVGMEEQLAFVVACRTNDLDRIKYLLTPSKGLSPDMDLAADWAL